jgi:pimeloyl-ACP methyl ester carboxylesterase
MLPTSLEVLPNGKTIRVARVGSGPPIVLLHGYPENLQVWSALAPRLAERHEVIALDWPGMGRSEPWPGGATPFHMADRLLALCDAWHIDRASLVGADMGGQPALVFAAQHPERTSGLVIMNSLVLWDEATSWEIRVLRRFGWNRFILRTLPKVVFARAERTFLPAGIRLPAELRTEFWETFRQAEVRRFIAKMCAGYQGTLPRLPALYEKISCPTLVLWGGRERHFPPAHAERLHALVRGSQLCIIPEGEHWMAWTLAEQVGQAIEGFLRKSDERL